MGGFDNVNVHIDRAKVLGSHPKGCTITKGLSSMEFYKVSDMEEILSGTRKHKGAVVSSRKDTQPHKQPKVSNNNDDNHHDNHNGGNGNTHGRYKYYTLPKWVKPDIKEKVIPSICGYIGMQEDPWSLNTPKFTFLQLIQRLFDNVFPAHHYTLATGNPIYEWCQQQCYNWWKTIQKITNKQSAPRSLQIRLTQNFWL
ncbi:hypothetical protein C8Q73DRAFT_789586 [Cubamyces lactineus]|nr:hypothetical protein C8Q73DRAFT_789586 [Cubamyces lactineus]